MQSKVLFSILLGKMSSRGFISSEIFFFVDCKLLLSWFRWPLTVASVFPTILSKFILSIPGHVMKFPRLIQCLKVEIQGEKAQPCK